MTIKYYFSPSRRSSSSVGVISPSSSLITFDVGANDSRKWLNFCFSSSPLLIDTHVWRRSIRKVCQWQPPSSDNELKGGCTIEQHHKSKKTVQGDGKRISIFLHQATHTPSESIHRKSTKNSLILFCASSSSN